MALGYCGREKSWLALILPHWHWIFWERFISTLCVLPSPWLAQLILKILLNNALDDINKGFGFAQTLTQKDFEFFSDNVDVGFVFYLMLILLLAKQCLIAYESCHKQNLVLLCSTSVDKVILTLLKEIITFHIGLTLRNIKKSDL